MKFVQLTRSPSNDLVDQRWDAAEAPGSAPDHARIERLWAETFDIPTASRHRLRELLKYFWESQTPASILYAVAYHYPAVPPWGSPLPDLTITIERIRERFTASRILEHGEFMTACLAWRLAYYMDDMGQIGPPPPLDAIPKWQEAYERGMEIGTEWKDFNMSLDPRGGQWIAGQP
ncbi:hypothetical protein ACIBF5_10010 [Micromonospora sp. NPDC050417]|uniref:hypothetical protein n=1 Tax=Micromonospora sp. NPDC050417 TaxID=3364280 RepID=UPI0037928658